MFRKLVATALTLVSPLAFSAPLMTTQDTYYVGGSVSVIDSGFRNISTNRNVSLVGLEVLGGYKYRWWLGGEVRVGASSNSGEYQLEPAVKAETQLKHFESIYYRMEALNSAAKIYLLLGASNVSSDVSSSDGRSASESEVGLSYGVGVGFPSRSHKWNTNFEWRMLLDSADTSFGMFGLSLDRRF